MPYQSRHAGTLADLLLQQGDIAAQRAARSGEMWGNVAQGIAGIPAGLQQRRQADQDRAAQQAVLDSRLKTDALQQRNIEGQINARDAAQMDEQATKDLAQTTMKVNAWLADVAATNGDVQRAAYRSGRAALIAEGRLQPSDAPEMFPGVSWVKSRMAMLLPAAERFKAMFPEPEVLVEVGPEGILTPRSQAAGQPAYKPPQAPEPLHPVGPEGILTPRSRAAGQPAYRPPPVASRDPLAQELAQLRLDEARQKAEDRERVKKIPSGYRTALERAIMSVPAIRKGDVRETATRLWQEGNPEGFVDVVRQAAIESEPVDVRNQVMGRMATLAALSDTRAILLEMEAKGIPTNWFSGSMENLARRVGKTSNPEYVTLANRLMGTLINYRRAATGVQFSQRESQDYQRMFPNYKNEPPVNVALIGGLERELRTYDAAYWEHKLGKEGAALVVGQGKAGHTPGAGGAAPPVGEFDFDPATGQLVPRGAQ